MPQMFVSSWLLRGVLIVAAAGAIGLVVSTSAIRGRIFRAFGWMERPIVRQTDALETEVELLFYSRQELVDRIVQLETTVRDVAQQAAQWGEAQQTLAQAYAILEYRERSGQTLVASRVLFREREGQSYYVQIDRGAMDGIAQGQAVVTQSGVLFGIVEEATATSARVALVTNAHIRVGVRRVSDQETIGVTDGSAYPSIRVRFVPVALERRANDLIVTSGIDPGIPANLILGTVREISDEPPSSHGSFLVEPAADLMHTSFVGVLVTQTS